MPLFVLDPTVPLVDFSLENFNCARKPYTPIQPINAFTITGKFVAYASPDSTYAVTKRFFDQAKDEILIGIYDFSADYVKELLLNAMERGVTVTLMLDVDSPAERNLLKELTQFGATTIPAPSCSNKTVKYFPNCHEKFIVIDNEWVFVQSGNYSKNSIPFNEEDGGDSDHFKTGNRDMGVGIQSRELAAFFKKVLQSDINLVLDAVSPETAQEPDSDLPLLVEFVPEVLPAELFPSKTFSPDSPITVTPVLSPDNYMQRIVDLLTSAKKSIFIENQYIRSKQPEVVKLLQAILKAKTINSSLDVRIILGKLFDDSDVPKEKENLSTLKANYGLELGDNIRYIDINRFVHCHNKLIVIDEMTVLISSQNWSDTAVSQNREAGVIVEYPALARYYTQIFKSDWETALHEIPIPGADTTIRPESLSTGRYTAVSVADYQEV